MSERNSNSSRYGFRDKMMDRARARHARYLANRARWISERMRAVGAHTKTRNTSGLRRGRKPKPDTTD